MDLTKKHLSAIEVLAAGGSDKQAGQVAGVGDRQIRKWRNEPTFKSALNRALNEVFQVSIEKLKSASTSAASTLQEIVEDRNSSPQARIRAAELILNNANKKHDFTLLQAVETLINEGVLEVEAMAQIETKLETFKDEIRSIISNTNS